MQNDVNEAVRCLLMPLFALSVGQLAPLDYSVIVSTKTHWKTNEDTDTKRIQMFF